jgi:hypothetical protein
MNRRDREAVWTDERKRGSVGMRQGWPGAQEARWRVGPFSHKPWWVVSPEKAHHYVWSRSWSLLCKLPCLHNTMDFVPVFHNKCLTGQLLHPPSPVPPCHPALCLEFVVSVLLPPQVDFWMPFNLSFPLSTCGAENRM